MCRSGSAAHEGVWIEYDKGPYLGNHGPHLRGLRMLKDAVIGVTYSKANVRVLDPRLDR